MCSFSVKNSTPFNSYMYISDRVSPPQYLWFWIQCVVPLQGNASTKCTEELSMTYIIHLLIKSFLLSFFLSRCLYFPRISQGSFGCVLFICLYPWIFFKIFKIHLFLFIFIFKEEYFFTNCKETLNSKAL